MNKQEHRIIDAARKVLSNWIDGANADVSGDFTELEVAFDSYYNPSAMDFDWQSFRAEAAKNFVSIMCNHRYDTKVERYPVICKEAIALADELIKQLKEKEE